MSDYLKYESYTATVHYSNEDDVFFGKVEGINDLITFEGSSVAELKNAFHEAVDDYLETCKSLGKSPEKEYKGAFNVRITPDLHKKAAIVAVKNQMNLNEFIKTAILYAVKHEQAVVAEAKSDYGNARV